MRDAAASVDASKLTNGHSNPAAAAADEEDDEEPIKTGDQYRNMALDLITVNSGAIVDTVAMLETKGNVREFNCHMRQFLCNQYMI